MQFKDILFQHVQRHPKLALQDIVKLIHQSEFAGGHFIADLEQSLHRLQKEWDGLPHPPSDAGPLMFEEIGGGLCRLHLAGLRGTGIQVKTVHQLFVQTAKERAGSWSDFQQKLHVLWQCCKDGVILFSPAALDAWLERWEKQGYPLLRHSETYRTAYRPAYRIVSACYRPYYGLFCAIDRLLAAKERVTVAIDGYSGAGKSALAALLGRIYDCNVFPMDHFFLPPEMKTLERLAETGGYVDYGRFARQILSPLQQIASFAYEIYDCKELTFKPAATVIPKPLTIVEGVYSMHPRLIKAYDLKVFLHLDAETQRERIEARNGSAMLERFVTDWIPREMAYFEKMQIEQHSDLSFCTAKK